MARSVLFERWPVAVGVAIGILVLLVVAWLVSPLLSIGLAVALLVAAAAVAFRYGPTQHAGPPAGSEIDRLHGVELALAAAADTEAAARELSKLSMLVLEAPAAVVVIDGVGDAIHMEAGDTERHPVDTPGSRRRVLAADGKPRGSIAVAARTSRPYDDRDDQILEALSDQMSYVLHRLALVDDLRVHRAELAGVLESSSDGIFSVGPDLTIRTWNLAMERISNIPAAVAVGQHCCDTFRPLDEDGEPLYDETCPGRKGAPVEVTVKLPVADGDKDSDTETLLRLDCAYSPMAHDGYVVVVRDITARPRIEDDKADILAAVSYELRTPLVPIRGFLDTLTERGDELDDAQRKHAYDVMLRETHRLERLVKQLRRASSLEEAVFQVMPERLDWRQAVLDQVESIQREQPNREFSVTIADDLPAVMADDHLTAQVLANLLSNAVRFSPERSPVEVTVEYARERVFTTITDEGEGIEGDDREWIFDKYTTAGGPAMSGQRGGGLGLYIVRRAVEAMGGMVWVDDGPEGGSAFTFTLPGIAPKVKRTVFRTR
ncbi:MAG TPA: ATP-binding protein [Acidimicrobiales bacterium]|jgi:nitrogen fixation/metabolism regulation signal transduction histidine kinase|nr:ATP-binding protein [Acidimicrobiales bacterium]